MRVRGNRNLMGRLIAKAEAVPTVDTHQHLAAEAPVETDLCRLMVNDNYLATDLNTAGMTEGLRLRIDDGSLPLLERWKLLAPFWTKARNTSYARTHWLTLRNCYGASDLKTSEIERVSARVSADFKKPGLYRRVLRERCNINAVLTQGETFQYPDPAFFNVARMCDFQYDFTPEGVLEKQANKLGVSICSLDDLTHALETIIRQCHSRGAVGFKLISVPWREPSKDELISAFRKCRRATKTFKSGTLEYDIARFPLICHIMSITAKLAGELGMPVAVHTGAPWFNWLDFRLWEPTQLIPLLNTFRNTRFDIYHAGIPFGTCASMMGKVFPNVWMNLCWAHVISEELAARAISEWLDLMPINKVLAFGGDFGNRTMALTYGHLTMARQTICKVLAQRIQEGRMTEQEAEDIIQAWFSDNPRELYCLTF